MKKILFLLVILSVVSCRKEEIETINPGEISSFYNEYGIYQKELLVYDISEENSILLLFHTDYPYLIENYIKSYDLVLELSNETENEFLKSGDLKEQISTEFDDAELPERNSNNTLSIELVTENIKKDIKHFYLDIKPKSNQLKSDFILDANYYAEYKTTGDFIGVSNYGAWSTEDKWDIYCYLTKKEHWYSINWDNLWVGWLQGHIYDNLYYAKSDYTATGNPWYKLGAGLYTDPRVPRGNFLIAYSKSSFRGHSCTIGAYDTRNCYVGEAPSGTTAFVFPNAQGAFYYTPVNGNECPYPGSTFDSENCFVIDIPSSCEGFVSANKWYVKTDIIN